MSRRLDVKYRCMHPSCCVNCREGLLSMDEAFFNELKAVYQESDLFRSPRGVCRMGFNQPFRVLKLETSAQSNAQEEILSDADPIGLLIAEHVEVIKKLDQIEDQVNRRDIDALWISTAELENDIIIHSGLKEEEVLFPALRDLVPLAETLVAIIKEDHREVLSLLHNFRSALEEDEILDSIITSMIVSLKSHIRKEDAEFFETVNRYLDNDLRSGLIQGFKDVADRHIPIVAGERRKLKNEKRKDYDDQVAELREMTNSSCCH